MGLLDSIEKALFEQKSEAQKEEELKGIKVFDIPAPERKFSWKRAVDLLKGKDVERPNRWHHQDIMLERGGNFDLIRVYKREMSKDEALKATAEFNNYMQNALMGKPEPKKEKNKSFSLGKLINLLHNASDNEVKMAKGKSREFNDLVEKEERRRSNQRIADNYKTVEISVGRAENDNERGVSISEVVGVGSDGSVQNLGKMYKERMTKKEAEKRRENGEKWREVDEEERKTYVRFEREKDDGLDR